MPPVNKSKLIKEIAKHAATRGVTIILDGDNTSNAAQQDLKYEFKKKVLTVVIDKLSPEELNEVLPIIQEYLNTHHLILDEEQEEILENYQGYFEQNPYKDAIDFFTGKIPPNDLNALKMSFFMKIQKENGHDIDDYKQQIRDRFGARGAYIANLCYAGYFEDNFKNAALKLNPTKFSEYYELRVGLELSALFVHSGMTMAALKLAFQDKIILCAQNGINKFRIHGFGRTNIDLIKELFRMNEDHDWEFDIEKHIKLDSPGAIEYDIVIL